MPGLFAQGTAHGNPIPGNRLQPETGRPDASQIDLHCSYHAIPDPRHHQFRKFATRRKTFCADHFACFVCCVKSVTASLMLMLAGCGLKADDNAAADKAPAYVDEAPLPQAWPSPGPYNTVVEKSYPAYRAAFTEGGGGSTSFWTLFSHIRKNGIPMTAPVEMAVEPTTGGMRRLSMAFLYQKSDVGKPGRQGARVEVRDIPASRALSYTWQGPDSSANLTKAKSALEAGLAERKLNAAGFRLLGYNGPSTPRAKKTWELQALLN
jgi:hypothetical protein